MNSYSFFIAAALPAHILPIPASEQTVSPEIRQDITHLLTLQVLAHIAELQETLGDAFKEPLYLNTYQLVLQSGKEYVNPDETPCPTAALLANKQIHRYSGDFNGKDVLASIRAALSKPALKKEDLTKAMELLRTRLREQYLPILQERELFKEKQLLKLNATRPEVVVLPNGVQYEIEPGDIDIRDVSRSTCETGIAFYTRITQDTTFNTLPAAIRQIVDQLPKASSWTFYIPYESQKAAEETGMKETATLAARRHERLQQLIPEHIKYSPGIQEQATNPPDVKRTPLLRIKVWKDTPEYPASVRPDTIETVI